MPLEVLKQIKYGKDRKSYQLKVGAVVADDFFKLSEKKQLLAGNAVKKTMGTPDNLEGIPLKELMDLTKMSVPQVKEFLDELPDIVMLEKYLDQENDAALPRKSIVTFIEKRIRDATGQYD